MNMKKIVVLTCLILYVLCSFALETKKVAILEVTDVDGKLTTSQKLMLRTNLAQVVSNTEGFEAYDRTNLDAIMNEHDFQRSGLVDKDQIRQLGVMVGAAYILLPEGAVADENNLYVTAQLLNVETGKIEFTANELVGISAVSMKQGCEALAKKILGELKLSNKQSLLEEEAERAKYYVYKKKNVYSYKGSKMDKKAYIRFLETNCFEAYKQYNKGTKAIISGWCLFGVGLACAGGGVVHQYMVDQNWHKISGMYDSYYTNEQRDKVKDQYDKYKTISYVMLGVGAGLTVTSIPLLSVGYAKQKKSLHIYNEHCSSPSIHPLTLNLTSSSNGLGLALQF